MKNSTTYILVLLLLGFGAAGYFMAKKDSTKSSSIDIRDRKFSVENREDIAKILIAQRNGKRIVLERRGNSWYADDIHMVHPNFMGNMLDVLTKMEMKYIPPRSAYDNMMKAIGRIGVKVEIYDSEDNRLKSYQVGGTTAGELGTVLLMDGYTQPYVMEVENFEGSLRGRFLIDNIDQIRDRTVFAYNERDIDEISIHYPKDKNRSFRVVRNETDGYDVKPYSPDGYAISGQVRSGTVKGFVRAFQDVDAEAFENNHTLQDSINSLVPIAEITVTSTDSKSKRVRLFSMIDVFNPDINTRTVGADKRVERYFADCSWGEFMIVQHLLFRKILWKYEDFY